MSIAYCERLDALGERLRSDPKCWLVTGCAGFIGSNLTEFLLSYGQKVVGIDNFSTGYRHNIESLLQSVGDAAENFSFIEGDIADFDMCVKACKDADIVLHQAALGSVPRSIDDPIASNRSNVTGFLNMLTAAKESGIKRFVYASSSSVYGDSEALPKVEERVGNVLSPYAATKKTNETYANVFYRTYGMETIGLRYFNVFGRRQDPNGAYAAVIPKWVASMLNADPVYINGDGETSRDFTYIDNVIQANILAGVANDSKLYGEVFNVAVGGKNTLNELYAFITEKLERKFSIKVESEPIYREFRPGDIRHSNADISKAERMLAYRPTHDIDKGLEEAIGWYCEYLGGKV